MAFNAGGDFGIWHFNGAGWIEDTIFTVNGENRIVLDNMWGESTNSLFAFGAYPDSNGLANNSVIVHYSDGKWTMLNTDGIHGIVENLFKDRYDNKIYLQTITAGRHSPDSTFIYENTERKFTKIYGNIFSKGLTGDISLVNGVVYFVLGKEIAKRENGKLETVFTVDNPEFYQKIWGRNSSDIFLLMLDGIVHYNGFDMQYLIRFSKHPSQIWGAVLFEKEVFFLVHENSTALSLIYHGRLK